MRSINSKKLLLIFTGVLCAISFSTLIYEHKLRIQYQKVMTDSIDSTIYMSGIDNTLMNINESISEKKLYYGNSRYRPNEFQRYYYNAAMEMQKVYFNYISLYSKNEKKGDLVNNKISKLFIDYSDYFNQIYQTYPVVVDTNGEEYINIDGEILKRIEIISQNTNDINQIIVNLYSDAKISTNDIWKVIIERLSEYTPKIYVEQ